MDDGEVSGRVRPLAFECPSTAIPLSDEGPDPLRELLFGHSPGCRRHHRADHGIIGCIDRIAVQVEKSFRDDPGRALIAVEETMIAAEPECISSRSCRGIRFSIRQEVARPRELRIDHGKVTYTPASAVFCNLFVVNGKRSMEWEPYPGLHFANSRNAFRRRFITLRADSMVLSNSGSNGVTLNPSFSSVRQALEQKVRQKTPYASAEIVSETAPRPGRRITYREPAFQNLSIWRA